MHPLFCERRARFVGSGDGESLVCVLDCPFISLIAKRSTLGNCSACVNLRVCVRRGICSHFRVPRRASKLCRCALSSFTFISLRFHVHDNQFIDVFSLIRDAKAIKNGSLCNLLHSGFFMGTALARQLIHLHATSLCQPIRGF